MKKISFSEGKFILYVMIYVIVFLFSLYIVNAIWIYSGPHRMLLYSLVTILVSQWIIYPGIFFLVLYRKDKNTMFFMDESTGDIRYHNNNEEMYFKRTSRQVYWITDIIKG